MMAVVLRHIYKDVLCGGIKGVSKWYILKNVLMWFVVIESISIFSSLLINTYYAGAIKSRNEIEVEGMLLKQGIVACATLVVALCLCPIVEEIIYRVIIQKMLDEKTKTVAWWISPCLTGILFGITHVGLSVAMIPYFILGTGIGIVYKKTENIVIAITIHSLNNLFASIFVLLHNFT